MLYFSVAFLYLIATSVHGIPLTKRIAQTISDSTAKWEQACLAAGGSQQCNPVSVAAFSTLLAGAGPCEQQRAGDRMIDLANTLKRNSEMIRLAQIFVQQPRNSPTSQSVQYCQEAAKNPELKDLFQCQFSGSNPNVFVGGVPVGQPGTIPFGLNAPVRPIGSCPANPSGPIPDGRQLVNVVQNSGACNTCVRESASQATKTIVRRQFQLKNGKDAQALNAKFATLSADSPCTAGEQACINGAFAQCVNAKFLTTPCGGSLTCVALPLVNKAGTSITCSTEADAASRIAETGTQGGITGSGAASVSKEINVAPRSNNTNAAVPVARSTAGGGFVLQNGKDAQKLNTKFAKLSANSACTDGEQACVGPGFAQCANGKFVVTSCAQGLTCAALPLVNKAGTSIVCTTQADALARIQATGATGGLTGA